jgi:hypothetical protein
VDLDAVRRCVCRQNRPKPKRGELDVGWSLTREYNNRRRRILDAIRGKPRLLNELIWTFAIEDRRVESFSVENLPADTHVPRSDYESTRRAARELIAGGKLRLVERRLTASDLVSFYPFQTRSVRIAFLRKHLLAPLLHFAMTTIDTSKRQYSPAEREKHALATKMPAGVETALREKWASVAERLLEIEHELPMTRRTAIFALRVKCVELLEDSAVQHASSLGELLGILERNAVAPLEREALELVSGLHNAMPLVEIDQADLKASLYIAADIRKRQGVTLSEEAKSALRRAAPAIVESLPGFSVNERKRALRASRKGTSLLSLRERDVLRGPDAYHGRLLDHLISRDMFRPFQFVERARQ